MKNYELRITNYELPVAKIICVFCLFITAAFQVHAQSTDQNFPTPITRNEISGRIAARDLGDARLTAYFYTFEGKQGDVFINVVTTNFNGDIDVFTAGDLRPLTKVTAYADSSNNETGRVVYLRQPLKLILRIEGRTPNDDAATFQIKFAGSFAASTAVAETNTEPEVRSNNNSDVRVNSVGTIIEVKPKPTPTPKAVIAKVEKPPKENKPAVVAENTEKDTAEKVAVTPEKPIEKEVAPKEKTVKRTPKPKKEKPVKPSPARFEPAEKDAETVAKTEPDKAETKSADAEKTVEKETPNAAKESAVKKKPSVPKPVAASELANINLVVLFKDGSKIERPMSEILKFGVDRGILTVISKDGAIGRYSILDIEKITVQ